MIVMFPLISQSALYYSDPEKEKNPTAELDFLFVEMHLIAGGGGVLMKFNFLIKPNFLFTSQPHDDKRIAAGVFQGENIIVKLAGILLARSLQHGHLGEGLPLGERLEVSTATEAATNWTRLCTGGLHPCLLFVCHHMVSSTLLSHLPLRHSVNSQRAVATQPGGQVSSVCVLSLATTVFGTGIGTGCPGRR